MSIDLRAFCAAADDWMPHRAGIKSPFAAMIGGRVHECATNGHLLVMVPTLVSELRTDGPNVEAVIPPLRAAGREASWSALLDHIGIPDPAIEREPCDDCKNTGLVDCDRCDGEGTVPCECSHCGDQHDDDCTECDGEGKLSCDCGRAIDGHDIVRVRVAGQTFNRHTFVACRQLEADVVRWYPGEPERAARIVAGGWTMVVMPLRPLDLDRELADFNEWQEAAA